MPDQPAPGARTLEEILREAGIERPTRGGRRRAPEPEPDPAAGDTETVEPTAGGVHRHVPVEPEPLPRVEPVAAAASAPERPPVPERPSAQEREPVPAVVGGAARSRDTAAGWALRGAELLVAAVLGVAVYYVFGVLWELYPYVAVAVAVVVLGGLAAAGQWRAQRRARPLPPLALGALLVVGAVLTLLPAAEVLTR